MAKAKGKVIQCPAAFTGPAPSGNLFALTGTYLEAQHKLQEIDLDPQTIKDTLEGLEGDIAMKSLRVIAIAKQYESFSAAIEAAMVSMSKRAGTAKARAEALRQYVLDSLKAAGFDAGDRIESPEIEIRLQRNPPSLEIEDATLIPPFYFRDYVPPVAPNPRDPSLIDKKAIKDYLSEDIKEGEAPRHVRGAKLLADVRLVVK